MPFQGIALSDIDFSVFNIISSYRETNIIVLLALDSSIDDCVGSLVLHSLIVSLSGERSVWTLAKSPFGLSLKHRCWTPVE